VSASAATTISVPRLGSGPCTGEGSLVTGTQVHAGVDGPGAELTQPFVAIASIASPIELRLRFGDKGVARRDDRGRVLRRDLDNPALGIGRYSPHDLVASRAGANRMPGAQSSAAPSRLPRNEEPLRASGSSRSRKDCTRRDASGRVGRPSPAAGACSLDQLPT
jgi:hypothetical protein